MMPAVVGFGGPALSGKSEIAKSVAATLGWPVASFGNYVRQIARLRGEEETRSALQAIGEEFVRSDCEGFCRAVLAQAGWAPGRPAVLDGVRHTSVVETIRRVIAPEIFVLVIVSTPKGVRRKRLVERRATAKGTVEMPSIEHIDEHSMERHARSSLATLADLRVQGVVDASALTKDVVQWLASALATGESSKRLRAN